MEENNQLIKKNNQLKFENLAEKRVNKAVQTISLIGKLSNTANYSFNEDHIKAMKRALINEVNITISKFETSLTKKKDFKFKK
tara:strand:- start:238 stop:486 length:249 start_codon:yes stop_codon:yes gene_type:complete